MKVRRWFAPKLRADRRILSLLHLKTHIGHGRQRERTGLDRPAGTIRVAATVVSVDNHSRSPPVSTAGAGFHCRDSICVGFLGHLEPAAIEEESRRSSEHCYDRGSITYVRKTSLQKFVLLSD